MMNIGSSFPKPEGRYEVAQGVSPGWRARYVQDSQTLRPGLPRANRAQRQKVSGWRQILCLVATLIQPASAIAQDLEISGTVVTRRGDAGVARAAVELEPLLPPHRLAELQLAGEPRPAAVRRARTDRFGHFQLDAPAAGFWRLVVRHSEYLPAAVDLGPFLVSRALGELRMQRRSELAARVVDGEGRPVAGATLVTVGWSETWAEAERQGWRPVERLSRTDADGSAVVACASSETVTVIARLDDRYLRQETGCGATLLELTLEASLSRARLIDAAGTPAAGVYGFFTWPALAFGQSDEEGFLLGPFATPATPPVAFADVRGYYGAAHWLPPAEDAGESEVGTEPTLKLRSEAILDGYVVDAFDEAPLDGVWVWLAGGRERSRDADATEGSEPPNALPPYFQPVDRGAFALRLPVAASRIRLGGSGYLTLEYSAPGEVAARGEELVARLPPAMTLPGRVVDAAGAGIAGVTVAGRSPRTGLVARWRDPRDSGRWRLERIAGRSGEDGSFQLSRIPPSVPVELAVSRGGFATRYVTAPPLVPGEPVDELVIALARGIAAAGLVVDETEHPIGGAEVALLPALTGSVAEQSYEVKSNYRSTTGEDGGFTLRDLPAGRFFLSARAAGYPELMVPGIEITDELEQPMDLGTMVLVPGVRLAGRVTDAGGQPVTAAELSLRDADGEPIVVQRASSPWFASTTSRVDGSFELDGLPRERRLVLLAVSDGYLPGEFPIITGVEDQAFDIELRRGARVSGVVIDDRGRRVAGARVDFQAGPELRRMTTAASRTLEADAEGRFEASGLRLGDYTVVAMTGAARSDPIDRRVSADGIADLTLELRRRAALAVSVSGPDGESVPRVWVWLSGTPHGGSALIHRSASTDLAGRALLQPLDPGSYRLSARHQELGSAERSIEVEAAFAHPQQTELRFERRAESRVAEIEVSGRVVDDAGLPIAEAEILLSGPGHAASTESASDGRFTLSASPGEYRLHCQHQDYAAAERRPITVSDHDVVGLEIELDTGATVYGRISGLEAEDLARLVIKARGPFDPGDDSQVFGQRYGTVDFAGELRVDGLGVGEWLIRAELLNPTRAAVERVTLERGQRQARVDLRFEPGYRLTGSVLEPGGPVAGGTVSVACVGEFRGETFTDDSGRFGVEHVPAGRCTVNATDPASGHHGRQQIELTSDTEIVVEVGTGQ